MDISIIVKSTAPATRPVLTLRFDDLLADASSAGSEPSVNARCTSCFWGGASVKEELGRREVIEPRRHQRRRWHIVLKRVMRVQIPPSQSTGASTGCALPLSFLGRRMQVEPSLDRAKCPLARQFRYLWHGISLASSPKFTGEASRTTTIALTVSWLLCVHILGFRAQTTTSELTKPTPFLSVKAICLFAAVEELAGSHNK